MFGKTTVTYLLGPTEVHVGCVTLKSFTGVMSNRDDTNNNQVYEKNIHETMKSLPAQRGRRKKDFDRVLVLFSSDNHARDRRNKVTPLRSNYPSYACFLRAGSDV